MPNTIGYSKAELIALCHLLNLKYVINGSGKVASQSIPEGSAIPLETITFNLA